MSEHNRKVAGTCLMVLAAALAAAGLFPLKPSGTVTYRSRTNRTLSLPAVPYLAADDLPNAGNKEELALLPGIGPSLADSILAEREKNGPFIYPEDLISVSGIGEGKLSQIRSFLRTNTDESGD